METHTLFLQWLTPSHVNLNNLLVKEDLFYIKNFYNPLATQDPRKYIGTQSKVRKYFIYLCFEYF